MKKLFIWFGIVVVITAALALVVPALPQNPQTQAAPLYAVNAKYANGTTPGYWPTQQSIPNGSGGTITAATGLNINIGPGTANCGSGSVVTYNGGTFALTASTTNYIYLNTASSCAPAVKTTTFVAADIPIAAIVTNGSGIVTNGISDFRTPFNAPLSSGGIPHTQQILAGDGSGGAVATAIDDGQTTAGKVTSTKPFVAIPASPTPGGSPVTGTNNATSTTDIISGLFTCPNMTTATSEGCELSVGIDATDPTNARRAQFEYDYGGTEATNFGVLSMSAPSVYNKALKWDFLGNVYLPQVLSAGCLGTDGSGKIGSGSGCSSGSTNSTWARQGALILPGANDPSPQVQEPSGIFGACESNAYAAYSSCLKIAYTSGWVSTGAGGAGTQVCFKETPGGTNSPIPIGSCISNHDRGTMQLLGGNYVLFAKNESTGGMDIYQSSTVAGLSSGLLHSNVLACGSNGNETANSLGRPTVWGSGSTWRMLYSCLDSSNNSYAYWLATASTATSATWTKASTSPKVGSTSPASSTNCFSYSGAQVFVQSGNNLILYGGCGPAGLTPSPYLWTATSTDNGTTWAQSSTFFFQAHTPDEGVNNSLGQLGDPYLVDGGSLNETLLLYGAYSSGCPNLVSCSSPSRIKLLTINQPLSTVINETTAEGSSLKDIPVFQVNGNPAPYPSLSFQGANVSYGGKGIVQTDGPGDQFQTGAGALSSKWSGSANLQIQTAGNVGDTAAGTTNDFAWFSGATYSADQCSYVTIGAVPATGLWVAAGVRLTSGLNGYALLSVNTSSSTNTYQMYKVVSNTFTTIGTAPIFTGKMAVGDVIGLCVKGTSLTSYRNGVLAETVTDSTNAGAGFAGMGLPSNQTAQISNFSSSGWVPSPIPLTALATQAADTSLGNASASAATPVPMTLPSCSGGSNALTYNTSTHAYGCNTISATGNYTNIGGSVTWTGCTYASGVCTVSGSTTTVVTLSSIPGTYLGLRLMLKGTTTNSSGSSVVMTFNSDTGSHYAVQGIFNTSGGSVTSLSAVSQAGCVNFPQTAGAVIGGAIIEIPLYADSQGKMATVDSNNIASISSATNNQFVHNTCGWNQTSAITSVTFTIAAGDFSSGFEVVAYGEN